MNSAPPPSSFAKKREPERNLHLLLLQRRGNLRGGHRVVAAKIVKAA
jgi:hypothetical protein